MKRRPKNTDYDSLPFISIFGYLDQPLDTPAERGRRVSKIMLEHLGDHRVRLGVGSYKDNRYFSKEHKGSLKELISNYDDLVSHMRAGTNLLLGTGVARYWDFCYTEKMAISNDNTGHGVVSVTMYMDIFKHLQATVDGWLLLVKQIIQILDSERCFVGLAHAGWARDLDFGLYYTDMVRDPMTWREAVEHVDWLSSGESRVDRIRAPTWGTYLGRSLVARLDKGDKGSFLRRFLEPRLRSTHSGEELPSGAVFVTTSNNPMEAVELPLERHRDPVVENAVWLWQEFRKAGMV